MKKFLLIVCLSVFFTASFSQGYKIKGEIKNMQDTTAILAYYFGGKQYATDTTDVVKGKLTFSGDKALDGGIYLLVLPDGKYFELIISEQKFSFTTDKNDLVSSMRFQNSKENTAFYEYLRYITEKQKEVSPLKERVTFVKSELEKIKKGELDTIFKEILEEDKGAIQKEIAKVDEDVIAYRNTFSKKYPNVFFSKIIRATTDIEIPETPLDSAGKPKENFSFYYYKKHFWDNMDFSDQRMLRTPVFFNKMDQYLEKISPKHPDSIIVSADIMIEKARANKEVFKYVVSYITSTYERSKIMGMDAVFVHMVEKYYMTAQCDWVKEKQLEKIIERAKRISPNMIGKKPPNLFFKDTSNQYHSLYHLQAKYTLLFFYDPDCGHCKKETPKVKAVCDSLVDTGVDIKVFAVTTGFEMNEWKEFIKKFNLQNWINVGDQPFKIRRSYIYKVKEENIFVSTDKREGYETQRIEVEMSLVKNDILLMDRFKELNPEYQENKFILNDKGKFICSHELEPIASSDWRAQYDIHSTPVIYLLNKDKEIIAKRINDKQIVKIIKREESLEE